MREAVAPSMADVLGPRVIQQVPFKAGLGLHRVPGEPKNYLP